MEIIIALLIKNLTYVAWGMVLLAIFWLANFAFSLYYNIKQLNEIFEFKRMLDGFYKLLAVIVGTALMAVGITLIPSFLTIVGLAVSNEVLQAFNILVVIGIYFEATYSYFTQAKETLANIVQFRKSMKEVKQIIEDATAK